MNNKLLYLLTFLLILSGCSNSPIFELGIDGAECKVCAKLIVDKLKTMPFISKAEFVCSKNNFNDGFVKIYLKSNNIRVDTLVDLLNKNGFVVTYIKGRFLGSFKQNDKFCLSLSNEVFGFKKDIKKAISYDKLELVQGTLKLNRSSNDYYFVV